MRRAMAEAEVGDDVFGDDPTVARLEAESARLFGKEAAVFLPSGTMANLVALLVWCRPGDEAIVEERSHSFNSEQGGGARFAGVQLRPLRGDERGCLDPGQVAATVRGGPGSSATERMHQPRTSLVAIENTHNFAGGRVQPLERVRALVAVARERGLKVHLDGARIWNAVVATGVGAAAWAEPCDSILFSLSKGLCCPAGSVLVGGRGFVDEARRARKVLGGGMRQVGVLAAPGLVALKDMVARLADDHANARALAEGLARVSGIDVDPAAVDTNIVIVRLAPASAVSHARFAERMRERGVLCVALGALGVRFVTHHDVTREDVERAVAAAREAVGP